MIESIEMLTHCQCHKCKGWWSIGDMPKDKLIWWCPWCGLKINKFIQYESSATQQVGNWRVDSITIKDH